MKTPEDDSEAVRVYRHTLGEVAEGQVVAAAEDILCDTWIDELERFRSCLVEAASSARCTDRGRTLRDVVREAQRQGDPDEIARAHQQLAAFEDCRHMSVDETCQVLVALDDELERVCTAGIERARHGREDLARLRTAWQAAYGGDAD